MNFNINSIRYKEDWTYDSTSKIDLKCSASFILLLLILIAHPPVTALFEAHCEHVSKTEHFWDQVSEVP